ncbi:MAG TPA: MmgE/PrpD family protein [Candidatus Limnocylindrales bacterium]|nr:MmgE/PrpD family protein [Candidatus Limnocylindrales bacterium]
MATIAQQLGHFVSQISVDNLPADVIAKAKSCLLYGLSIAMAAHDSRQAQIAEKALLADESLSQGGSTTILSGKQATPGAAAFANGVLFQSRGQSDAYGTMAHFGPAVVTSVLALAEANDYSGREIIPALVAGYEVAGALAKDHIRLTVEHGWRGSPTYDVTAAAAATARLMGLDAERTANAISLGAGFSFGNVECNIAHTMETQFQLGLSARNGLLCSAIAKQRGSGAPTAIEGKAGFLNLFAGTLEFAPKVTAALGCDYEILNVTFKRYPTSMIAQSPTYIAIRLARNEKIDADAIQEIIVELDPFEAEYPGPGRRENIESAERGAGTAQGVAVALVHSQASRHFLRQRDDTKVNRLLDLMALKGNPAVLPQCAKLSVKTPARLYVEEIKDGSRNHLFGFADTVDLVRDLQPEMRISAATLEKIIAIADRLEQVESIRPLMALVSGQAN